ncbi:hypothetical protein BLNAU_21959 [Blattamonas nauphoetae]|uniref:Right handed beta helix domain-containing protein n=1 Tax=Blattamonas nauphoetae TaxID=2049346 RepID=A0ABQ9WUG5_9EUKA|nr:hypothetical protein BLNAU_21959 [Blattamonas nauphoetae]
MFLSLIVVFASIHSDRIDLLDVMKEYADDVSEIKLKDGEYCARDLPLKHRKLTFIGNVDTVTLDMRGLSESAFDLESSTLTLISISIKPPQLAVFTKSKFSKLNVTSCKFVTKEMEYPILEGISSQLIVQNVSFTEIHFMYSLIQGPPGDNEAVLSLIVQNCSFSNFRVHTQRPLLAGADVQNVSVVDTSFSEIKCTNVDPLPDEAIEGTADREVSIQKSTISNVDGALSGALVFGMQATKLYLIHVTIEDSANAIRHSNNVAFAPKSEVVVRMCTTKFTKTTEVWPNGGFLYLPHNQSMLTIHHTTADHSSAPNGSGGWVFVSGQCDLDLQLVTSKDTSAGKCGGFVFAGGMVEKLLFSEVDVNDSKAEENGGALFVSNAREVQISHGVFMRCGSIQNGGAVFVDKADETTVTFERDIFDDNEASKGHGPDVVISYDEAKTYRVQKADFVKCVSTAKQNGVWFLPFNVGTEWSNTRELANRQIIVVSVVCGCVFLALCILIPCLACCCYRRRKNAAYKQIETEQQPNYSESQSTRPSHAPNEGQNDPQTQINYQQSSPQSINS